MNAREGDAARQALDATLTQLAALGGAARLAATGLLLESFCLLVGAAVSLARAASYRSGPRRPERVLANSRMVLDALVRGEVAEAGANSEWSAGYYLSNATHRLNAAAGKLGADPDTAPTLRTDQEFQPKWDAEVARLQRLLVVLTGQASR